MKRLFLFFFILSALSVGAQVIRYDTIRVPADDLRNIHLMPTDKRVTPTNSFLSKEYNEDNGIRPAVFDKRNLRFGANLGLSISRNYTNLGFGPQVGYQFNDFFMAGAGLKYYYSRANTYYYEIKSNLLGANVFGYFYPVRFITIFAQPELNYIWSKLTSHTTQDNTTDRGFVPSLVIGTGFRLGRSHITLNYDLIQDAHSPHPDGVYLGVSAFF